MSGPDRGNSCPAYSGRRDRWANENPDSRKGKHDGSEEDHHQEGHDQEDDAEEGPGEESLGETGVVEEAGGEEGPREEVREEDERARRRREGADRGQRTDAGQADRRADGGQGVLEVAGWPDASGHDLRRHVARDPEEGKGRPLQEDRPRVVRDQPVAATFATSSPRTPRVGAFSRWSPKSSKDRLLRHVGQRREELRFLFQIPHRLAEFRRDPDLGLHACAFPPAIEHQHDHLIATR